MEYINKVNKARREIAKSHLKDSIATLYELPLSNNENQELLALEARYSKLTSDEIKGIISQEYKDQTFNQISTLLIAFIQNLQIYSKSQESIPKQKVIVHFFNCNFDTSEIKKLIIFQNKKQNLFSFSISNWEYYSKKNQLEKSISNKQYTSKLNLVDEVLTCISNLSNGNEGDVTNLILTSLPIPQNYYSWNSKDRNGILISMRTLERVFQNNNNVNRMAIKIIQRMLVYGMHIQDLNVHLDSRGCLFDLTINIKELETVDEMNYLCDDCIDKIMKYEHGKEAYRKISEWIDNNI